MPSTHLLHVQLVAILICHSDTHSMSCINPLLILLFSQFVQWKHNLDREVYYMDMGENLTVCLPLIHEQLVQ